MEEAVTSPGALEDSDASPGTRRAKATVFSALLRGLSDTDAEFVAGAMTRAHQATKAADERGEAPPSPIW